MARGRRGGRRRGRQPQLEQRLAIEAGRQDGLHRLVAILPHRGGPGAGRLQPARTVALGEAEDALGPSQAIERALAEEGGDERGAGRADLGGPLLTPPRRLEEKVHLVRREVRVERPPLAGARREMRGDERMVVEELDLRQGRAHPELLADEAMGRGVKGPVEHHVAVRMELRLLPADRGPRRGRQRQECRALNGLEDDQGLLLDRTVAPAAGDLHTPAERVAVGVMDVAERAPRQAVALDVVDAALFDLPLVLGGPHPAGSDEEPVMFRAVPVDPLHFRIVQCGAHDSGLEIVQDHAARDRPKPLDGSPVQPTPGGHALVEDELHVLVTAVGQGHHERPGAAQAVELGIEEQPGGSEIDLSFRPRLHFEAHGGPHRWGFQAAQEALHRRVAPGEAVLLHEELEDGLALHALLPPGPHLLLEGGDAGLFLRRPLPLGWAEQGGQGPRVGQLARQQPVPLGPAAITGHGVPAQGQLPGDPPFRLAQAEPAEHFAYIGHLTPPSSHRSHLRLGVPERHRRSG
jgi:hypothetical protein